MTQTTVTIEGSRLRPSVVLAAGEQRTVVLTPRVQRLIDQGYVIEIDRHEPSKLPHPAKPKPVYPVKVDDGPPVPMSEFTVGEPEVLIPEPEPETPEPPD